MPGPDFGWINEANPLGPPADPDNNTPLSAAELETFRVFVETFAESVADAKVSDDVNLGGIGPSGTIGPSQNAVQTYVANHSGSGSGSTGYVMAQDPSTADGAAVLAGVTGSTNVHTPIQNMINANDGVAMIYFPPGVYLIGAPLTLPSNTHLVLDPQAIMRCNASAPIQHIVANADFTNGNSNITIDGGQWDGQGVQFVGAATTGSPNLAVTMQGGSLFANIKNGSSIEAPDFIPAGAHVSTHAGSTIVMDTNANAPGGTREMAASMCTNGVMRFVGGAASNQRCRNITVRNVNLYGCAAQGLKFNNCSNFMVHNNRIHNNGQDGIFLFGTTTDAEITANYCYLNGDDDIAVSSCTRATVTGNVCGPGTGSGGNITCRGANHVAISGNVCYASVGTAIYLSTTWNSATGPLLNVNVTGNVVAYTGDNTAGGLTSNFTNIEGHGITVANATGNADEVANVNILSNVIANTKGNGIMFTTVTGAPADSIRDCSIKDNTVFWESVVPAHTAATSNGICYDTGATAGTVVDLQIAGNRVVNPPLVGIDFSSARVKRLQVNYNSVRRANNVAAVGISLDTVANLQVNGNVSYDTRSLGATQTYGISVQNCTGSLMLCQNDCTWVQGNVTDEIHYVDPGAALVYVRMRDNPGRTDTTKG